MIERSLIATTYLSVIALAACGQYPVGSIIEDGENTTSDAPIDEPNTPKSADAPRRDASTPENDASSSPRTSGDATTSAPDEGAPVVTSPDAASTRAPGEGSDAGATGGGTGGGGSLSVERTVLGSSSNTAASRGCQVPGDAQAEDSSNPTTVVGNGNPSSCTSAAFVEAVARGGVITFNCGANPHTIVLDQTAKVRNAVRRVVIDGGGRIALSGGRRHRILYQNTCDEAQGFSTDHCDNQDSPQLTVQNLTFVDGDSRGTSDGGGAIFAQGGRFKIVNSHFFSNVCHDVGPDVGGGAVRAMMQYNNQPVYVVNSTFGGEGRGNVCSNGGALSSIGVSYVVLGSVLTHNRAIGRGANPAQAGTPGGGSGGAIYNDGTSFNLRVCGSVIEHNHANAGGGGIFFVSNDRTGALSIESSTMSDNRSGQFENYPGMYVEARGEPHVANTSLR